MHVLPPIFWIFGETLLNKTIKGRRTQWLRRRNRRRICLQNSSNQTCLALTGKSFSCSSHFIKDCTKGKNIGSRICITSFQLFRRHVLQRSQNRSFCSQRTLLCCKRRNTNDRLC